jgi:hypothetical protein
MKEKLNQFILNTQGHFQEVSYNKAIYQCLDLVYEWVFVLGFPKSTIQHLYAYEVFTKPNKQTHEYFDIIKNTPDFIPQDGDIGVFNKTASNIAGHIGICLSGGNINNFPFYEQNAPLKTPAHITQYKTYTNFLGVLRPKVNKLDFIISDQTLLPIIDANGKKMEVQACRAVIIAQERAITNLKTEIDTLRAKIAELQEKLDNATQNALGESSVNDSGTVTVSLDSFDTSTQNTESSFWQELARFIRKLLHI